MFSKNIVHLIILDIKNYIYHKVQQIKENFWPSSFIKITYKNTAMYCKLFLFDYFSFKEMLLQMLKKIFNTFFFFVIFVFAHEFLGSTKYCSWKAVFLHYYSVFDILLKFETRILVSLFVSFN